MGEEHDVAGGYKTSECYRKAFCTNSNRAII